MTPSALPSLVGWSEVQRRLELLFPEGTHQRAWLTRDICAKTVFSMLYVGAVEGRDVYAAPKHVYRMTDKQAQLLSNEQRIAYHRDCMRAGYQANGKAWFSDNTREPIRDESLREALMPVGAVGMLQGMAVTSSRPRHFLMADFAALFAADVAEADFSAAASAWRKRHLTPAALARAAIVASAHAADAHVSVRLPDGTTHSLEPGPTQAIAKGFLENFVPRFFTRARVLFLSQSGQKVVHAEHQFAKSIGLDIETGQLLPDLILAETEPGLLLVFVEFVASDGPIHPRRKAQLVELAKGTKLSAGDIAFVTAFLDRSKAPFTTKFRDLAWNSFAWCAAEPEKLVALFDEREHPSLKLASIVALMEPPVDPA